MKSEVEHKITKVLKILYSSLLESQTVFERAAKKTLAKVGFILL